MALQIDIIAFFIYMADIHLITIYTTMNWQVNQFSIHMHKYMTARVVQSRKALLYNYVNVKYTENVLTQYAQHSYLLQFLISERNEK